MGSVPWLVRTRLLKSTFGLGPQIEKGICKAREEGYGILLFWRGSAKGSSSYILVGYLDSLIRESTHEKRDERRPGTIIRSAMFADDIVQPAVRDETARARGMS